MSNSSSSPSSGGIGVCGLLGCIFVTLKLCNVIDWSWWWVTAPFWGGLVIVLGVLGAVFAVAGIAMGIAALVERRRR